MLAESYFELGLPSLISRPVRAWTTWCFYRECTICYFISYAYICPWMQVHRMTFKRKISPGYHHIACVASVSARVRREKLGREQKKGMTGEGEGKEGSFLFSPPPPPSTFFFCSRSNFRAITRPSHGLKWENKAYKLERSILFLPILLSASLLACALLHCHFCCEMIVNHVGANHFREFFSLG